MGLMHYQGEGTTRDRVEALKWFLLAEADGNEIAARNRAMVETLLKPEQVADAKRRAMETPR
jgi:TPR repeat protein